VKNSFIFVVLKSSVFLNHFIFAKVVVKYNPGILLIYMQVQVDFF